MWADLGYELPIQEGVFWLDNGLIKGFKKEENSEISTLISLYKYTVSDDLSIHIKPHKDYLKLQCKYKNVNFETWQETVHRLNNHISGIESKSIKLLQQYGLNTDRKIINTNSTGKDSMVVLHLAEKAGLKFETYFNVTTLDVAESNRMAKELGFKFTYPDYKGFYNYIKQYNVIPTRLNRCCCRVFKEEPTIKSFDKNAKLLFLFGMRNSESIKRSEYTDEWCNRAWGSRDWIGILPIREWSEFDVWLYTLRESIRINGKYKMGYSRVGCGIACPNYSKTTWVLDKYWYPTMYNRWRDILRKDFIDNNKWLIMNCTVEEYCNKYWNGGIAHTEPTEDCIKEYSKYSRIDYDIAKNYFNHTCMNGCSVNGKLKRIKDKETLAMNMKYYGRQTNKFMCKKCLMKEFNWTKEDWNKQVQDFKEQGCVLF